MNYQGRILALLCPTLFFVFLRVIIKKLSKSEIFLINI